MPIENNSDHSHFSFRYRAYCNTCKEYVGDLKSTKPEADADSAAHRSAAGNSDHKVTIEVEQKYHIL